jgi:hypothetical protein
MYILILVVVHYTVFPVFRTRPGDKGIIPLPGSDDSKLFWKNDVASSDIIPTNTTPIGSKSSEYSFMVDINLDNPTANTGSPRILLSRGDPIDMSKETNFLANPDTSTILTVNPNFNVCIYLDKLVNDLYISVQTLSSVDTTIHLFETVIIPNIPVRKSIRLGVSVSSKFFEVYINGYLIRSKAFTNTLRETKGDFQPPIEKILSNTARVKNLRIWNRILSSAEFRLYNSSIDFTLKELPDTCSS